MDLDRENIISHAEFMNSITREYTASRMAIPASYKAVPLFPLTIPVKIGIHEAINSLL